MTTNGEAVIALLRAVNVGGRRLPMADLRRICEEAGFAGVRTYLQSGNAVFTTTAPAEQAAGELQRRLGEDCGYDVDVVVRTHAELDDDIARCPYDTTVDPTKLVVWFSSVPINAAAVSADPAAFGHETFAIDGREIYLWLPDGQAESQLLKQLMREKVLRGVTGRNWRTVTALAGMAAEVGGAPD